MQNSLSGRFILWYNETVLVHSVAQKVSHNEGSGLLNKILVKFYVNKRWHSVETPSMVDPQWGILYWGSKWIFHTVCWDAVGCEGGGGVSTSVYFGITCVCFIPSRLHLKIGSHDRLIFNVGLSIPGKDYFYLYHGDPDMGKVTSSYWEVFVRNAWIKIFSHFTNTSFHLNNNSVQTRRHRICLLAVLSASH